MNDARNGWRLDRTIPIAVVGVLVVQTIGIGAWVGTMSARVSNIEITLSELRRNPVDIARIEATVEAIQEDVRMIRSALFASPSSRR